MGICGLVLFFVLLSGLLNTKYLEEYYLNKKKNLLIDIGKRINESYMGNPEDIVLELERIERTAGVMIFIVNKDEGIKYGSTARILNQIPFQRKPPVLPKINFRFINRKDIDKMNNFQYQNDPELKIDYLNYIATLNSREILILRVPLAAISENVDVTNDFMLFTGLIIIIIGSILAFVFSKKFTKPILELNKIAQHMANLDFTKKCSIQNEDEVGELGKSINHLSLQLDNAITELNAENRKLILEIEEERKIDEMRKEFISSVSHELKTPIALIQGFAEGLRDNVNDEEESRNYYCDVIIDEAGKMDGMVKELLNLSQFESGFLKLTREDFDICSLVQEVLTKYNVIFTEKGIRLDDAHQERTIVNGDILRIEQVLVNYINNALNHVDSNKLLKVSITQGQDKIRVSVFNTGRHIPTEALDKIWTSFYKVDAARTRDYGGYGLGLSIVRAIQNLHNNSYGVENIEGGVLFWFDIDKAD